MLMQRKKKAENLYKEACLYLSQEESGISDEEYQTRWSKNVEDILAQNARDAEEVDGQNTQEALEMQYGDELELLYDLQYVLPILAN